MFELDKHIYMRFHSQRLMSHKFVSQNVCFTDILSFFFLLAQIRGKTRTAFKWLLLSLHSWLVEQSWLPAERHIYLQMGRRLENKNTVTAYRGSSRPAQAMHYQSLFVQWYLLWEALACLDHVTRSMVQFLYAMKTEFLQWDLRGKGIFLLMNRFAHSEIYISSF